MVPLLKERLIKIWSLELGGIWNCSKNQISAVSGRIIEQKVEFKGKVKIDGKIYKHYDLILVHLIQVYLKIKSLILIFGMRKILFYGQSGIW